MKKTLPYWKNWKKTERLQQEPEELEKRKKLLIVEPLRLYLLKPLKESRLYWRPPEAL